MQDDLRTRSLLHAARELYDARPELRDLARQSWRGGFTSGAEWMRQAIGLLRSSPLPASHAPFASLGTIKYALALAAAIIWAAGCVAIGWSWLAIGGGVVFYAVEAQMVFLFPLAIDGKQKLFRQGRRWTRRAGGTIPVMATVIPLAAVMLLGGFVGGGFVRSWAIGCLAVCIWYERLRARGQLPPLHVRVEQIDGWNLARRVRLLYASDLHLGRPWTRKVPWQLRFAVRRCRPDLIVLGGDLIDCPAGLSDLRRCVRQLCRIAPVYAIAGNHDHRAGIEAVRSTVEQAGAQWMNGEPVNSSMPFELCESANAKKVSPKNVSPSWRQILCVHDPAIFPAAAALGFDLVLAGHLHGGQCVLAEWGGRLYPGALLSRWTGLRFERGRTTMFVSRGVADTLPLRWNCPREMILCEIS